MSIRTEILKGLKKSRKKSFTQQDFDKFATSVPDLYYWPRVHSVRARVSELTKAGLLLRTGPNTYIRGEVT